MKIIIIISIFSVITCFGNDAFALTGSEVLSALPAKHVALKNGVHVKILGTDYIERRVLDDSKQSYFLITKGMPANEEWFSGTPSEYALIIQRRSAPASGMDASYWQKQSSNLDELGKSLNPRNAMIASSLFYGSRLSFDLGTAMITGGVSGLTFAGSSLQFLKQTALGPKPKDLMWIYIACKNLDYLTMVEKELPTENAFFAKVYEGVEFGRKAVEFLKGIDESTKNINNILNSSGRETLKGTGYANFALTDAFSGFGVSLTKTGVLWGLSKLEDELTRYMIISDVHVAVLKAISENLINDTEKLKNSKFAPKEEVELRNRILKQQMLYYNVYAELVRAAHDFSLFARKETNWKGKIAVSNKSLQQLIEARKKAEDISKEYTYKYLTFNEELYRSLFYYGLMKMSKHTGDGISKATTQFSNIAGEWNVSTKLISHNCPIDVPIKEHEEFRHEYCQNEDKAYLWCDYSSVWGQVLDGSFSGRYVSTADKRSNGFKVTSKWNLLIDKSGNSMTGTFTTVYNRNSDGVSICQKNDAWQAMRLKTYKTGKQK